MTRDGFHLDDEALSRYLEGDLSLPESGPLDAHLSECVACRRELSMHRVFLRELDQLEAPEPPPGFDAAVLAAVLPRPNESLVLVRAATRLYGGIAALAAALVLAVLTQTGPAPAERVLASGIATVVGGTLGFLRSAGSGFVDLVKAGGELVPLATTIRSFFNGLETAASALAPQVFLVALLVSTLAVLVLVWASSQARPRGVPHVSLTL